MFGTFFLSMAVLSIIISIPIAILIAAAAAAMAIAWVVIGLLPCWAFSIVPAIGKRRLYITTFE